MTKVLISLVGHQPLPLLLAIRHIKPDKVIFLYSNEPSLLNRKDYLLRLLPPSIEAIDPLTTVDPWDIRNVPERLQRVLEDKELLDADLICDVTGGTKAMSIGLSRFAAQVRCKMVYLESDSGDPLLQWYTFDQNCLHRLLKPEPVANESSIQDFLNVYLGKVDINPVLPKDPTTHGALFENDVRAGFVQLQQAGKLDEIKYAVKPRQSEEIDIILRRGNRFALVECKQGRKRDGTPGGEALSAYGILQLNNLASDRYLGTYTRKILAVTAYYRKEAQNNAKMADEHKVYLLELPEWQPGIAWTPEVLGRFVETVETVLGKS